MTPFFAEIRAYVGLTDADSAALRELAGELPGVLDRLVDEFYRVVMAHEETRRIITDASQLDRLKSSMRTWATSLVAGPHDEEWFRQRSRIGRRHVEVGLPQRYMPLAMNRLRSILVELAIASCGDDRPRLARTLTALGRVCDLELTIMLESYQELHQDRVRQAERLGTLGRLAASVSHELKNPLAVINTSLLLLERQLALPDAERDPAQVEAHLARMRRNSRHAGRMASQLLDYARSKRPTTRRVPVQELLGDAVAMVEERDQVAIETRCEPPDAEAWVDPGDVLQVLSNLVRNAAQAIRDSGTGSRITLQARREPVGLSLVVADDGPGVAPENLERIFEPLFTTRPTGTGLGLAISRDVVEAHGGRLTVSSTPGHGATFTVFFPQESPAA